MSAMPLALFLEIAAACAPGVAPETLAAIARTESGFNPLAIGVNGPGGGPVRATSAAEAVQQAQRLIAAGRSIDLGLMQINSANLRWLNLSVADAFDPCRSVAAGAEVLTAYSRYNTGTPTRGFANGYVQRVVAAQARIVPEAPRAAPRPVPPPMTPDLGRGEAGRGFVYSRAER
jgi:type IV secretion system protein VirB1